MGHEVSAWSTWDGETRAWVGGVGVIVVGVACTYVGAALSALNGGEVQWAVNPGEFVVCVWAGHWEGARTWAIATVATVLAVSFIAYGLRGVSSPVRQRGDEVAKNAGSAREVSMLSRRGAGKVAERLGINGAVGLPIGRLVGGGMELYSTWEYVSVMVAGPRTGKTTAWLAPRMFAAPGALVATSNKRDLVDITRQGRSQVGRVWVFDPQGIASEERSWWWDILASVTTAVDAMSLAEVFIDSQRDHHATRNAYFDGASKDLLTALLLAAAKGGGDIRRVHEWLTRPLDDEPVRILERTGHTLVAQSLRGMIDLPAETRGGVYGGASQTMSFLLNDEATQWILPPGGEEKIQFDPTHFASSTDTLYCLSQEGRGSASPIVTALTVAVIEAALNEAKDQEGGRLPTPMFIALDEAANVCRWRELPDLYSHFGSRGIIVDTMLQSWSQGVSVWGDAGMNKLWSAANVKAYGGGVSEDKFLQMLSHLIGTRYVDQVQTSTSRQGSSRSISRASHSRPIAPVDELAALPPNRAWVFTSGAPAIYVRTIPYWSQKTTNLKEQEVCDE